MRLRFRRVRAARDQGHDSGELVGGDVIVLSGGGARGAAQAGMLQVLISAGVRPVAYVGCSAGALNAVFMAAAAPVMPCGVGSGWTGGSSGASVDVASTAGGGEAPRLSDVDAALVCAGERAGAAGARPLNRAAPADPQARVEELISAWRSVEGKSVF